MNHFPASSNSESFVLDRAVRSSTRAFAGSNGFLPQKEYSLPSPTDYGAMASWSRVYDLRGGALQPWVRTSILPDSMEFQQAGEAQMARAVEDAIVAERNRLARELHDAVTQTLFAASLIAEVLPDLWEMDEAEAHRSTEELRQLTRGALAEMRTLLFELRPAALNQARLPDLLRQLGEAVMGRKRLPIDLDVVGDCEIPCDVKVEIYRIAQESLNNVVKYARATRVEIKVRLEAGHVQMEIRDDGVGFDPACVKPTNLGLRIMRERAEAIHAQLQVRSQPGLGTSVSLEWHK
ncbi:MAG TPA: sensor histidine kinase [Anaerolineales bacterium]|nr:sensor histidine kinase [Anaerolineales bacterium]